MTESWQWFLVVGGGIVFAIGVIESLIRGINYLRHGKKNANAYFETRVTEIVKRHHNEEYEKDCRVREQETQIMQKFIASELQPIKEDIHSIKSINQKLLHAQITDLKIKLNSLYHDKFDKKGVLNKVDQANWDKWYSDYAALGGNSDIKKMDELIQKARVKMAMDKVRKEENKDDN